MSRSSLQPFTWVPFLVAFGLSPSPVHAYTEDHPGLAIEKVAFADGEVRHAALGDADGDGYPDLFVLSGTQLQLWRNDGRGGLVPSSAPICSVPLVSMVVGDIDKDGHLDVVGALSGPSLVFLRGLGNGAFEPPVLPPAGSPAYRDLEILDDGGVLSIVATRETPGSGFDVLRYAGAGAFEMRGHLLDGRELSALHVADLNGDGHPDVTVADVTGDVRELVVLLQHNDDLETVATLPSRYPGGSIQSADLNGDGHTDLVLSGLEGGIRAFVNAGDGRSWSTSDDFAVPGYDLMEICAADVNEDGTPELFIGAQPDGSGAYLVQYECRGELPPIETARFSYMFGEYNPTSPNSILSGDMNGDGHPDLVLINRWGAGHPRGNTPVHGMIGVVLTRPNGAPGAMRVQAVDSDMYWIDAARVARGAPPVLLVAGPSGISTMHVGPGDQLSAPQFLSGGLRPHVGDFDGDGREDVAIDSAGVVEIRLATPDGAFGPIVSQLEGRVLAIGDLDGDRRQDLVLAAPDGGVRVAWGDPHGRFRRVVATPLIIRSFDTPTLVVADADGDGRKELIDLRLNPHWNESTIDTISTYRVLANGKLKLIAMSTSPTPDVIEHRSVYDAGAADLDGSAGEEIVVASGMAGSGPGSLRVFHASHEGAYRLASEVHLSGENIDGISIADLDGDGDLDVACVTSIEGSIGLVHVCWNDGTGNLEETWTRRIADAAAYYTAVGDFDGDGAADLAIAAPSDYDRSHGSVALIFGARPNDPARLKRVATPAIPSVDRPTLSIRMVTPNPTHGAFAVRWISDEPGPAIVDLVDVSGRRIRSVQVRPAVGGERSVQFPDLGTLPSGLYWVRVHQGGKSTAQRVVLMQ